MNVCDLFGLNTDMEAEAPIQWIDVPSNYRPQKHRVTLNISDYVASVKVKTKPANEWEEGAALLHL